MSPPPVETSAAAVKLPEQKVERPASALVPFFSAEWGLFRTLWVRDMLRLKKEHTRWIGVVLQPLVFWLLIGLGFSGRVALPGVSGVSYLEYFFPGIMVMIVLFTTIFATMTVIEDRQSGFLQAVLVAPGSRGAMVLGKVAGVTTVALIQVTIFMAVAPFAGYSLSAVNWPLLVAIVLVSCMALTSFNMAVAWKLGSTQAYHAMMSIILIPLWILSGAMFPPAENTAVSWLMTLNPLTYAVNGVRGALGSTADSLVTCGAGPSLGILSGFLLVSFAMALWTTRRRSG